MAALCLYEKMMYNFGLLGCLNFFFAFPFSPFLSLNFAAVIDLLLGLLPVKKFQRKRQAIFTMK